jgi:hypothetical protein
MKQPTIDGQPKTMKSPIKTHDRTPSTQIAGQPEAVVGSIQFSPLSLGSPDLEDWLAREGKTILQHAAAHEALADQLSRRYAELFPAETWIDSGTALDRMVLEISSLRWELARLRANPDRP